MIEQFGEKFRITQNENHEPIIACRPGWHIYEMGEDSLGLWIESSRPNVSIKAIQAKGFPIEPCQVGDDEATARYRLRGFKDDCKFLRAVGAHKRRYLSDENRAAAVERLAKYAPPKGTALSDWLRRPRIDDRPAQ